MNESSEHLLSRDCEAIAIPYGTVTLLPKGTQVRVLQKLGGSLTVSADFGGLYRIDPESFDALGLEAPPRETAEDAARRPLEERVWAELRTCYDPEIPIDIVELGLVYDVAIDPPPRTPPDPAARHEVAVKMTLTAPGCGMGDVLAQDVQRKLERLPEIARAQVEIVFDPPWNQAMMSEAARLQLGMF
jgi:probable FeS assembly SUF system protein SufT